MMSNFDLKDCFDNYLYEVFNLWSKSCFFWKRKLKKKIKNNNEYYDIHKGGKCYILGNGPSLLNVPEDFWTNIQGEKIFCVNSFYKSIISEKIDPYYYFLMDNNYWNDASHEVDEIIEYYKNKSVDITLFTDYRMEGIVNGRVKNPLLYAKKYPVDNFCYDISNNFSITMNVVSFAIVVAMYMGFKEIVLVGCDYNLFASRINNHCYDDEEENSSLKSYNLAFYLKYYYLTTKFHYLIKKEADRIGVKIVNATEKSLLDAYPIVKIFEEKK